MQWVADPIGNYAAVYAAGGVGNDGIIAGLTYDASVMGYYSVSSGNWTFVDPPSGVAAMTSIAVTWDGVIVVTDTQGRPYYYLPLHPGWHNFGNAGDQFIASGDRILALNPTHGGVLSWNNWNPSQGAYWTFVKGRTVSSIVASPDVADWGTRLPGEDVFYDLDSNETWYAWLCRDVAVTANNTNVYNTTEMCQAASNGEVFAKNAVTNLTETAGGQTGKLISGEQMFAAGCPGGSLPCVKY
jgi:hypothetical protein